jgi:hypothetical protein
MSPSPPATSSTQGYCCDKEKTSQDEDSQVARTFFLQRIGVLGRKEGRKEGRKASVSGGILVGI